MNAQIKKGILEMCILWIVKESKSIYGYDLIKRAGEDFPEVNESTFYSILRRLEQGSALKSTVEKSTEGPPRKYFSITASGEIELQELITEWNELKRIMEGLGIN